MTLILSNSRDVGNKFLFGHWMMRNSMSQLPFKGPGFGRVNYWMNTNSSLKLEKVEKDMIEMKRIGLKAYIIEMCGKIEIGDECWNCCGHDKPPSWDETTGALDVTVAETSYFSEQWFSELKVKYKQLIQLCRKYNMWLLNFVFNDNRWQKQGYPPRVQGWIEEYPNSTGERRTELLLALREAIPHLYGPPGRPTTEELDKVFNIAMGCGGQERLVICPINEPETNNGKEFERRYIPIIKNRGFASCTYNEIKYGARFYQGGHASSVASASCPDGFGVSDNGSLLLELYPGHWDDWIKIPGSATANTTAVRNLIYNYKHSGAKAGFLYAIHYNKSDADTPALQAIKDGWYAG